MFTGHREACLQEKLETERRKNGLIYFNGINAPRSSQGTIRR